MSPMTLRKEYAPRLTALRQDIVKIYAARFTEQELKDTLAFYKSPVGKKLSPRSRPSSSARCRRRRTGPIKLNEEALQRFRAEMTKARPCALRTGRAVANR